MKNKGFTLAELIGVIVVLALISLVTIPAVSNTLKTNRKKLCATQANNIVSAAKNYGADNVFSLDTTSFVTLATLIRYGYIDDKIENPVTKEVYRYVKNDSELGENEVNADTVLVKITKNGKKFEYTLDDDIYNCG